MATLTLRTQINRPLTNAEVDANFTNLNTDIGTRVATTTYDTDQNTHLQSLAKTAEALILASNDNLEDFLLNREQGITLTTHTNQISTLNTQLTSEVNRLEDLINSIEPGVPPAYKAIMEQGWLVDGFTNGYMGEMLRGMGASGIFNVRNYGVDSGFDATHRAYGVTSTAFFQHNHPDYYGMIGLGEQSAIINGYYFRTTHNDPILLDSAGTYLLAPDPRSGVAGLPTGVTVSGQTTNYDFAGNTQARYYRNFFNGDVDPASGTLSTATKAYWRDAVMDLVYMECWLEALPTDGALSSLIQSFRHKENANTLRDLLNFAQRLNYSGAKDTPENGSFRCGLVTTVNDTTGVPEFAYINFRMRAQRMGTMAPITSITTYGANDPTPEFTFDVVSSQVGGTHGHAMQVGFTPAELNSVIAGTPLYYETSFYEEDADEGGGVHSHIYQLTYAGGVFTSTHQGMRISIAADNKEVLYSGTAPTFTSLRAYDGTTITGPFTFTSSTLVHGHTVRVLTRITQYPFDLAKAVTATFDNSNVWALIKDQEALMRLRLTLPDATWYDLATSAYARFRLRDDVMRTACESVWGLDGPGAYIPEAIDSYGSTYLTYNTQGGRLNMAKYNRIYAFGSNDAAGRSTAPRGFNDPNLYVAKTTMSNVAQGYTWMIPFEMTLRTPLEKWNPFQFPIFQGRPDGGVGTGSGTYASPWNTVTTQLWWYMLPTGFFNAGASDPADTAKVGGIWTMTPTNANTPEGKAPADASGIYITKTTGSQYALWSGVPARNADTMRFRYPIAPLWHDWTYGNIQLNNYKDAVKSLLLEAAAGTLTNTKINNLI